MQKNPELEPTQTSAGPLFSPCTPGTVYIKHSTMSAGLDGFHVAAVQSASLNAH